MKRPKKKGLGRSVSPWEQETYFVDPGNLLKEVGRIPHAGEPPPENRTVYKIDAGGRLTTQGMFDEAVEQARQQYGEDVEGPAQTTYVLVEDTREEP